MDLRKIIRTTIKEHKNIDIKRNLQIYDSSEFNELLEKVIAPSSFICSFVASAIKMLEGDKIKVYGFSVSENPDASYFVEDNEVDSDEGHHFAVMGDRWIIDPWVYGDFGKSVFDLSDKKDAESVKYLYGDKNKWTEITNRVESFKTLFPKTYKELIRFKNNFTKDSQPTR